MIESDLKGPLCQTMRERMRGFEITRLENTAHSGDPDILVTGCGWTSLWEVKYADPDFKLDKRQAVVVRKLAMAGYARYIIYRETANHELPHTIIAHPDDIFDIRTGERRDNWKRLPSIDGFNHVRVAAHIYSVHMKWILRH